MCDLCEIYKKEIEVFMATMGLLKGNKVIITDPAIIEENRIFIKNKMNRLKSGNYDEKIMDKAIEELIPYLYQKD